MKERIITERSITQFKKNLRDEEKSDATIDKYLRDVMTFCDGYKGKPMTKDMVIDYKEKLMKTGYAVRSVNSMLASINSFMTFLGWDDLKVKNYKIQQQVYCPEEKELTKSDYFKLCDCAMINNNERLSLIIQTICATGIRISELQFITVEAVNNGETIVNCKGKIRTIFIVKPLQRKLLKYITKQKINSGPVFITSGGKPISRTNVWRDMKKICGEAKVDSQKVFPHNLRHLFARTFYDIDKDIAKLADILGHSSINTTRIYIASSGSEHKKYMENMKLIK